MGKNANGMDDAEKELVDLVGFTPVSHKTTIENFTVWTFYKTGSKSTKSTSLRIKDCL